MNDTTASSDDKTMAMLAHLGGIVLGFIPALVIWLIKKDQGETFAVRQAKEALNFQITMIIAFVVAGALMMVLIGFLLVPALVILNLVFCILGGVAAGCKRHSERAAREVRGVDVGDGRSRRAVDDRGQCAFVVRQRIAVETVDHRRIVRRRDAYRHRVGDEVEGRGRTLPLETFRLRAAIESLPQMTDS